jgi:predicted methyltransferase
MNATFPTVALVLLCGCSAAHHENVMHRRFDDPRHWAKEFDAAERDAWQKPDEVIAALQLAGNAVVADLGAGTGYFTLRLANAVRQGGKVYGADVEGSMVAYLKERAARAGVENVEGVFSSEDDAKLPAPVDLVLLVDTYHHLSARPAYFTRLKAQLKPGGRLAIIDFRKSSPRGPPAEHKLEPAEVEAELAAAGFAKVAEHGFLPDQYFLVFAAP